MMARPQEEWNERMDADWPRGQLALIVWQPNKGWLEASCSVAGSLDRNGHEAAQTTAIKRLTGEFLLLVASEPRLTSQEALFASLTKEG